MYTDPIVDSRFMLPAPAVAELRSALSPAYRAPATPAPTFTGAAANFGSTGGYVDRDRTGSFASLPQLLDAAGLSFAVDTSPVFDDRGRMVDGVRAVRRTDTGDHFGTASESYRAIGPVDAFSALLGPAVAAGVVTADRAGLINGKAFVQCRLALESAFILDGDEVKPMLTGLHTWDAKSATIAGFSPTRVVCKNTYAMAGREASAVGFRVSKRGDAIGAMRQIGEDLNRIADQWRTLAESWRFMARRPFSQRELRDLLARVYEINAAAGKGDSERLDKLQATIERLQERGRGANIPGVRGSAWGVFCALTEHNEHHAPVRGALPEGDRRWERVLTGEVGAFNSRAQVEVLRAAGATESQARATLRGALA